MRKLNADAAKDFARKRGKEAKPISRRLGENIAARRHKINRPWTRAELKGKPSAYDTYAEGERSPFRGKEVLVEEAS